MVKDEAASLARRACAALQAKKTGDASAAVAALAGQLSEGATARRCVLDVIDGVVVAAEHAGPEAKLVLARSLWIKTIALERGGQFDLALQTLDDLIRRQPLRPESRSSWDRDVGLAEVRIGYRAGQSHRAARTADEYIRCHQLETDAQLQVAQARWFRRFAGAQTRSGSSADVQEPRIVGSTPEERMTAARAAHLILWSSLEAVQSAEVFDVIAAVQSAFEREEDPACLISMGSNLIEEVDWFLTAPGAFLGEDLIERACVISMDVIERFRWDDDENYLHLLARARWSAYRALGSLGRAAQLPVVVDEFLAMGPVAADVLGELIKAHRDTDEPQSRSYGLNLAMMRGIALCSDEAHLEEGISTMDDAIAHYGQDGADVVQSTLTWAREVRDQIAE